MLLVKIKKLNPDANLPEKKSLKAAAFDLYSAVDVGIPAGKTRVVSTGLAMDIPEGFKGEIYSRSGLASKGVIVANQPGKIDSDYRGEIKVILHNLGDTTYAISRGDRIAQFEVNPVQHLTFVAVKELNTTDRGINGFGSTGQ